MVFAIIFWVAWGYFVNFFPPKDNFFIAVFFFLLLVSVFLSGALIFANSRRGLLLALFIVLLLILQYFQIANVLNIGLLMGIFLSLEFFFSRKNH